MLLETGEGNCFRHVFNMGGTEKLTCRFEMEKTWQCFKYQAGIQYTLSKQRDDKRSKIRNATTFGFYILLIPLLFLFWSIWVIFGYATSKYTRYKFQRCNFELKLCIIEVVHSFKFHFIWNKYVWRCISELWTFLNFHIGFVRRMRWNFFPKNIIFRFLPPLNMIYCFHRMKNHTPWNEFFSILWRINCIIICEINFSIIV